MTYVESRQIYCHFYEQFALRDPNFVQLLKWQHEGRNIQICGYDAYPMDMQDLKAIDAAYLDKSVPFGHERVLATLLMYHGSPELYPWRVHRTLNLP